MNFAVGDDPAAKQFGKARFAGQTGPVQRGDMSAKADAGHWENLELISIL